MIYFISRNTYLLHNGYRKEPIDENNTDKFDNNDNDHTFMIIMATR